MLQSTEGIVALRHFKKYQARPQFGVTLEWPLSLMVGEVKIDFLSKNKKVVPIQARRGWQTFGNLGFRKSAAKANSKSNVVPLLD